jgi:hypothetical protein
MVIGSSSNLQIRATEAQKYKKQFSVKSFSIISAQANFSGFPIHFHRGSENEPTFAFDRLDIGAQFSQNDVSLSSDQVEVLNRLISDIFLPDAQVAASVFGDPKAFQDVISSHQMIIGHLEESLAQVGNKFADARLTLETEYEKRRVALDDEQRRRLDELQKAEAQLDERRKALDDRDNTHARRQIRNDLKKRIDDHAKSFKLTDGTRSLRWPINVTAILSLVVLAVLILAYGEMAYGATVAQLATPQLILLVAKPVVLTLAFLGILTWYIRWMNRWFERHAEAEFQLKQFELDIDRASWVVETALEWRQAQHSAMPDHLIEAISKNLFSRAEKDDGADMHPADYLASALLGSASGVKLKLPVGEIEYEGKALKAPSRRKPPKSGAKN